MCLGVRGSNERKFAREQLALKEKGGLCDRPSNEQLTCGGYRPIARLADCLFRRAVEDVEVVHVEHDLRLLTDAQF